MEKTLQAAVKEMWANHWYRVMVQEVENRAPIVPHYDPIENNIEQIKFGSAQKQLHDLVMAIIKPKEI